MTTNRPWILLSACAICACAPQPTASVDMSAPGLEGLQQVNSRHFDAAFVRPGVRFADFDALRVDSLDLDFVPPDPGSNQVPLSAEQKADFYILLRSAFLETLMGLENLSLTRESGRNVLALGIKVENVNASIAPQSAGRVGRASIVLEAYGEATLVIELRDSESDELLARVLDARAVEGVAITKDGNPITSWEDVDRLADRWASIVASRLDVLVSGAY